MWENEQGDLVDVTPHEPSVTAIRFISDDHWVYTGKLVDNIRINRTKNPLVDDYILLAEAVSQAHSYGTQLSAHEFSIPESAAIVGNAYAEMKQNLYNFILRGGQLYSACYCGQGKTYKSCHGSQLRESIAITTNHLQNVLSSST